MATLLTPATQRVILYDVSWEAYERLAADHENRSAPRFTYDQGKLEIMSPLPEHEEYNRSLEALVVTVLVEWRLNFRNLGSTTLKRADLERGIEPDSCFYIQNVERVRGKSKIDLSEDPPPDLVIEIDITSPSLDKLPIYAHMGVPEVWRYNGSLLQIYVLRGVAYRTSEASHVLSPLRALDLSEQMTRSKVEDTDVWLRELRDWARSQSPPADERASQQ
jgi:Uma2 family endonuclease